MTREQIDRAKIEELLELEKKATAGPWRVVRRGRLTGQQPEVYGAIEAPDGPEFGDSVELAELYGFARYAEDDAALIAAARNALRPLAEVALAAIRHADAVNEDKRFPCGCHLCNTLRHHGLLPDPQEKA